MSVLLMFSLIHRNIVVVNSGVSSETENNNHIFISQRIVIADEKGGRAKTSMSLLTKINVDIQRFTASIVTHQLLSLCYNSPTFVNLKRNCGGEITEQ